MPVGAIILINGYPGVGKYSIAAELAKKLPNSRVMDMHLLDAAAGVVHIKESQLEQELAIKLRRTMLESIAKTPPTPHAVSARPPVFICTDSLFTDAPTRQYQEVYLSQAKDHHLPFIHLIVTCSTDAHVARATQPSRNALKEQDESHIIEMRMESEIAHFVKPGRIGQGGARGLDAVPGLAGEYEIDNSNMDIPMTAGILSEYVVECLKSEHWFVQMNRFRALPPSEAKNGAAKSGKAVDDLRGRIKGLMRN